MATLKDKINRILGNNVRLLLPSYWWKRAFGLVIDKIEEVENAASGNGITIVSSEEELNTLDLPNGSVASVNGVKKMKFSECYQLSSADNDLEIEDLVKKLTIVKEIGVNFPLPTFTTEYDATYRIYNLNENQISGSVFILIDGVDYRVIYTTETDREEFLIKSQSDIDRINDILGSGDFYYTELENNGLGSENVKIIDTTFYVVSDSISATAYIKGDSWERLAKESDLVGIEDDVNEKIEDAVGAVVFYVDTNGGQLDDEYIAANAEQYKRLRKSDGMLANRPVYVKNYDGFLTAQMVVIDAYKKVGLIFETYEGRRLSVTIFPNGTYSDIADASSSSGVEQIIFYATESDAFPLTDAQIAHNVESMQKQRTAFLNDTPVSFLISVNSDAHQLCEPAAFYSPSNNTAIPVLFYIMGGGYYQFAVTCNWDGTATVEDVNWIDAELSDTSKNPVQNKVIKAYVDEKVANSGGGSSVDVDTELSNTSTNPVQNKVITETISAIDARVDDIEYFLEHSNLTLTIKSNQSSDATISAVKASIKYENKTVESGSGIIELPSFTTITITFPNVEGYKTPEPITFDTIGHPISYTAIYETELVNINLSAWDASSVSGQVITINGKDYTWSDTTISHKVAFGTEYWVYANDKNGYTTKGKKFIASQVSRDVEIVYNAMEGSFITIDQNIADPTTRVSGDIGGEHIQLIRNNSHRYLGKYTADGTMTVCQLDDEDSNYYSDGSSALLDGSQGDVFMKLPKFFYTVHERRPDVYSIGFYYGDNAPSNEWVEWRGDELIGVFKTNDAARSTAVRSSYGLSKDEYSRKAAARGNGYSLIKWKHNGIIAALYFAFYGNTNSQEVIGIGLEAGNRNCGSTASLGMSDTSVSEEAINLWGLENWWGAGYEFFENVIYYYDTHIWKITEDDGTVRERKSTINGGFLGQCYIDFHLDFGIECLDSKASYSATTGYCDRYAHYVSSANERPVLRGVLDTSGTGLLGMHTDYSSSASVTGNYFGGSRICFKGTILTNNDSTAFKALTPIN